MIERRNVLEIMIVTCELLRRSQTRINLLFTMSEIPQRALLKGNTCEVMFRGRYRSHHDGGMRAGNQTIFLHNPNAESAKVGGGRRDRTDDLMLAKHALSQLSYGPVPEDECPALNIEKTHALDQSGGPGKT